MTTDPATHEAIPVEVVRRALRSVRPSIYRVGYRDGSTTVALVLDVSAAGRRNAAARIVAALTDSGMGLVADDPIAALAEAGEPEVTISRR